MPESDESVLKNFVLSCVWVRKCESVPVTGTWVVATVKVPVRSCQRIAERCVRQVGAGRLYNSPTGHGREHRRGVYRLTSRTDFDQARESSASGSLIYSWVESRARCGDVDGNLLGALGKCNYGWAIR